VPMAAVVGVPHQQLGRGDPGVVVLRGGHAATAELIEFVVSQTCAVREPRSIEFVDTILLNPAGKP
jgi:acyl-coenzyme A synthetase/AMP-(fatty) acid ligase